MAINLFLWNSCRNSIEIVCWNIWLKTMAALCYFSLPITWLIVYLSGLYPQSMRYCSLRSSPLNLAPPANMQVSWAPVIAKAAQEPQDIWFLTDVTNPSSKNNCFISFNFVANLFNKSDLLFWNWYFGPKFLKALVFLVFWC